MKNTKNKTRLSLIVLSIPAVIVTITLTLTLSLDKSKPIALEAQNEPEIVKLEESNPAPTETEPLVITTTPQITTTEPSVTMTPTATTETPASTTTISPVTTIVVTTTPPTTTTAPPIEDHRPPETTFIDGQKYVWNPIVGWCCDNGPGTVTIMDAQSDGHSFYIEPDGRVNLGKVVTPDGEIISYEEYRRIKESR